MSTPARSSSSVRQEYATMISSHVSADGKSQTVRQSLTAEEGRPGVASVSTVRMPDDERTLMLPAGSQKSDQR